MDFVFGFVAFIGLVMTWLWMWIKAQEQEDVETSMIEVLNLIQERTDIHSILLGVDVPEATRERIMRKLEAQADKKPD